MRALRSLVLLAALCAGPVRADVYVVVNAANPVHALTHKEALDLFMGRNRTFPGSSEVAAVFDLPRDSGVRGSFYQALTSMSPAQINSYWARLMFTGQTLPPQAVAGEQAMIEVLRRNPLAVGYLGEDRPDKSLRVVLVLKGARP